MYQRFSLYLVILAQALSTFGNNVATLAIPWLVLARTGNPLDAGLVAFGSGAAAILGALFGGVLVDRIGPKRIAILSDVLSASTIALIPVFLGFNFLPLWLLIIIQLLGTLFDGPGATARDALIPQLAPKANIPLVQASSWQEATQGMAQLTGPLVGGAAIVAFGAGNTLWITTLVFILAALAIVLVRLQQHKAKKISFKESLHDLREGYQFLRKDTILWPFNFLGTMYVALFAPLSAIVVPTWFFNAGANSDALGLYLAVGAVGFIVGAIGYSTIATKVSPYKWLIGTGFVGLALSVVAILLQPGSVPLLGISFLSGMTGAGLLPIINTIYYTRTPKALFGRVNGTSSALALAAAPFSILFFGWFTQYFGPIASLWFVAIANFLLLLYQLFLPAIKLIDGVIRESQKEAQQN